MRLVVLPRAAALAAALMLAAPGGLRAQQPAPAAESATPRVPETIRGRVVDDSARAVAGAAVTVTRGPDRLVQQTTTDSAGGFSVHFAEGTGDYLVHVTATGFASARRRVQRLASERVLTANFTLARDVATLAAVRVTAATPVRATPTPASAMQPGPGDSERWQEGVQGQIPPTVAGDLAATAATTAGVTLGPSGPSILGGGGESNLTTLNGMGMAAGSIPRAARTETRVTGATFDPTRGGFSGANIDVRLGRGDRFYQRRNAFVTLDAPALQFTDALGRSLGTPSGGARGSVGADGELIRQALTYNVALDFARASSDPATLLDAGEEALLRAGLSPDSAERLLAVAGPILPLAGHGEPDLRRRDALTWLGRLDDTRDSLVTRALTTYLGATRDGAVGLGPLVAPASGGERRERTMGAQLTLGEYVGRGDRVLVETRISGSRVRTGADPYLRLPSATVLVRSPTLEEQQDVSSVSLGGNSLLAADEGQWTLEGSNETFFNAGGRRHRFKTQLWGRLDGLEQEALYNRFGTFAFNSIDDLEAGRATRFTRALSQPRRAGRAWNAAMAMAHTFAPSRQFNAIYGARVEASGFLGTPKRNPSLEQALGVRTGTAPRMLHVSPRAGFTWTYNRNRDNGSGMSMNSVGRFYRSPAGTIRGGIGEFRDLLRPNIVADARAATGLPGGALTLSCIGSAVPAADFERFAANPSTIPMACVGGGGILEERVPSVTLIDPAYDTPRSWRASLDWQTSVKNWMLRLSALVSLDRERPGTYDANFAGTPRLTLDESTEGGRPVYVSTAAIDTASGALSAAESRRAPAYGRVGVRRSDLRGHGGQVTLSLAPDMFRMRRRQLFGSMAYTLQAVRRQFRGFDGGGFGDPRDVEWAPDPADARHVLLVQAGLSTARTGTLTLFARAQSGLPFTPVVQGDVDGDGRGGDRAFVPNPGAIAGTDGELAADLRALMSDGSASARSCLRGALGEVARRNGCRGPWTQTLNMQWRPPIPRKYARRVTTNVYLQNVLGGIDQLVHGGGGLRGWGSTFAPDPVLFVPRGFDATARRFRYGVNRRFADTRPARTLLRDPFRVVLDFSIDFAVNYDVQQLRRALEPVRTPDGWRRRSADSLAAFYLGRTSSIHRLLLSESDSLFLTADQIARLQRADSVYSAQVRALYVPLGEFLAGRPREPGRIELDTVSATGKAYWKVFWRQPEIADSVITPLQRELMPMLKTMLGISPKDRETSQWMFGHPVTLVNAPARTQRRQ